MARIGKHLKNCSPEERLLRAASLRLKAKMRGAVRTASIKAANHLSAGRDLTDNLHVKDITGQRFGLLTVLSMTSARIGKRREVGWLCRCDCGAELVRGAKDMRTGQAKSCGNTAVHRRYGPREQRLEQIRLQKAAYLADNPRPLRIRVTLEQRKARVKQWRIDNPDRNRELIQRWVKAHPEARRAMHHNRRAKTRGGVTAAELTEHRLKHGKRCAMCRVAGKMTIDHIVPLAAGGPHTRSNIQFLCMPCNSAKRDLAPETFARMKGLLL